MHNTYDTKCGRVNNRYNRYRKNRNRLYTAVYINILLLYTHTHCKYIIVYHSASLSCGSAVQFHIIKSVLIVLKKKKKKYYMYKTYYYYYNLRWTAVAVSAIQYSLRTCGSYTFFFFIFFSRVIDAQWSLMWYIILYYI